MTSTLNGSRLVGRAPAGTFRGTQSVANEVFATVPQSFNDFRAEPEQIIDGGEKWGTLMAIDLKAKGKILWQQKTEGPLIGGVSFVVLGLADGWHTVAIGRAALPVVMACKERGTQI
jgi:hypothetical protein